MKVYACRKIEYERVKLKRSKIGSRQGKRKRGLTVDHLERSLHLRDSVWSTNNHLAFSANDNPLFFGTFGSITEEKEELQETQAAFREDHEIETERIELQTSIKDKGLYWEREKEEVARISTRKGKRDCMAREANAGNLTYHLVFALLKKHLSYFLTTFAWFRTFLCFVLVKTSELCLPGAFLMLPWRNISYKWSLFTMILCYFPLATRLKSRQVCQLLSPKSFPRFFAAFCDISNK